MKEVILLSRYNLLEAMVAQTKSTKKTTDKQQKIVETAIKFFAEKGYANTSTSEIAKTAEVSEGTIFRHYGTKDNLLISIIVPFLKESIPAMAEEAFNDIMSDNVYSFEDFLRALLKNRSAFIEDNKEIFQIVIKEILYNEALRNELIPYFAENIGKRLLKVIGIYQERGELNDVPREIIQRMVFTSVVGYFVTRFVLLPDTQKRDEEAEIEHIVRFVMDGIRNKTLNEK